MFFFRFKRRTLAAWPFFFSSTTPRPGVVLFEMGSGGPKGHLKKAKLHAALPATQHPLLHTPVELPHHRLLVRDPTGAAAARDPQPFANPLSSVFHDLDPRHSPAGSTRALQPCPKPATAPHLVRQPDPVSDSTTPSSRCVNVVPSTEPAELQAEFVRHGPLEVLQVHVHRSPNGSSTAIHPTRLTTRLEPGRPDCSTAGLAARGCTIAHAPDASSAKTGRSHFGVPISSLFTLEDPVKDSSERSLRSDLTKQAFR